MSLGLESLNLDFQESKLYIILLANGPQSMGELIKQVDIVSADIEKGLEGLKKKGYVHEIQGIANRYHAILPYRELRQDGKKTISEMEALASQLDEHISMKLETILSTMEEESERMSNALMQVKTEIDQLETKAANDIEELTAKNVLEVEQENVKGQEALKGVINQKQEEHKALLADVGSSFNRKTDSFNETFDEINKNLETTYNGGIEELKISESNRSQETEDELQTLISASEGKLVQGLQSVRESLQNTGNTLFGSIDKQNEIFNNQISKTVLELASSIENTSTGSQENLANTINTYHTELNKDLELTKNETKSTLESTQNNISTESFGSSEKAQQAIEKILTGAQTQLAEVFEQTQTMLTQKLDEAKKQVDNSLNQFSDTIRTNVDVDFQKIMTNTEGVITKLVEKASNTHQKASSEISQQFETLKKDGTSSINSFKGLTITSLNESIDSLKKEIQSHMKNFESVMTPQEKELKEELERFNSEFTASRNQSLNMFIQQLEDFKTEVTTRNRELSEKVKQDIDTLKQEVLSSITELTTMMQKYDENYSSILIESSTKTSEGLITKTRVLQEKVVNVLSEMTKTADHQISVTNQLISDSMKTEMSTFENEMKDYALKFDEVSKKNADALKNYLFSLEKLASLVTETPAPNVQTAPIISKQATLQYIESMFSRLKGGMTLLVPSIEDIPVDSILATKNHQRINLVSVLDPETHKDLLKKLLQKPNVRVRKVDVTKAGSIEGYLAADRDGEEVIIGVREDEGETITIASLADSFIVLMGKIVLGDYFLARSQEIPRADVGL